MQGVVEVYDSIFAFAARKEGGAVVTLGESLNGGDSSAGREQLAQSVVQI